MMRILLTLFLFGLLPLVPTTAVVAQDLHFSQFVQTPLLRNPAMAGLFEGDIRIQGVYRNQWSALNNAYQSGSFNGEFKFPQGRRNDFITTGLQVAYDMSGDVVWKTTTIQPALTYHKNVSEERNSYLSVGILAGSTNRKLDRSRIRTESQFDGNQFNPTLPDGENFARSFFNYFDAAVGLNYSSTAGYYDETRYFVGLAVHHFNKPNRGFYTIPEDDTTGNSFINQVQPKWVASGGVKWRINDFASANVQLDAIKQGPFQSIMAGAMLTYKLGTDPFESKQAIHGGAYVRWNDAIIPMVRLDWNNMTMGLSYDVTYGKAATISRGRGAFELSLAFVGFLDNRSSTKDAEKYPRF